MLAVLWSPRAINSPWSTMISLQSCLKERDVWADTLLASPFTGPWDCLYWVEVVRTEYASHLGVICVFFKTHEAD